jgi:hypothetical protein
MVCGVLLLTLTLGLELILPSLRLSLATPSR